MSINIHNGTSFNEVSKVHVVPSYSNSLKKTQRVWVHNGTKYVMVKGRLLEVVWEVDMSMWGGASWDNPNRFPDENRSLSMYILSNGDLLNVVNQVMKNNDSPQYSSGRYALQKISSSTGAISQFGTTSWSGWNAVSGYYQTDQPIGVIKCNDYYVAYSTHGIFYLFNSNGAYKSKYENETWHTDGSCKYINWEHTIFDYGTSVDFVPTSTTNGCIYYVYFDQNPNDSDSSAYRVSCYRLGVNGTSLYNPYRHYAGEYESRYYGFSSNLVAGTKTVMFFSSIDSSYDDKLVVFRGDYSYNSTVSDVSALCSLTESSATMDSSGEHPCFIDGEYVYTISQHYAYTIRKRSLTDLSLVWELSTPRHYNNYENRCIHQTCPSVDGGFMLPNGTIIYPDGTYDKTNSVYEKGSGNIYIYSYCYNETEGFGYMNYYDSDYYYSNGSGTYNANGLAVNKVIKFKEVRR